MLRAACACTGTSRRYSCHCPCSHRRLSIKAVAIAEKSRKSAFCSVLAPLVLRNHARTSLSPHESDTDRKSLLPIQRTCFKMGCGSSVPAAAPAAAATQEATARKASKLSGGIYGLIKCALWSSACKWLYLATRSSFPKRRTTYKSLGKGGDDPQMHE